ncbi:MAG: hypothetical protein H7Y88_09295 [Phycisphaerales bacterium]|nr:hypothetical protein [Phycisphaerales bacterium]
MNRSLAPLTAALLSSFPVAAFAQDCPPELFDYGSFQNPETVLIVLDHYGAAGPLLPLPADYDRADRDIGLIRAAVPFLAGFGHSDPWERDLLIVRASGRLSSEAVCSNVYYQAEVSGGPEWYFCELPGYLNLPALASMYESLPGVLSAGPNHFGCAGSCGCRSSWVYEPRETGTWRWRVIYNTSECCWGCSQNLTYDVTEAGDVLIVCAGDWTGDGTITSLDITLFLFGWSIDVSSGYIFADFNGSGATTSADITAFLAAWFDALANGC